MIALETQDALQLITHETISLCNVVREAQVATSRNPVPTALDDLLDQHSAELNRLLHTAVTRTVSHGAFPAHLLDHKEREQLVDLFARMLADAHDVGRGAIAERELELRRKHGAKNGVKSKAFKEWFGDWESDPANASKVVNKETGEPEETHAINPDGKPLVVFHGTMRDFDAFKTGTKNAWSDSMGFDTYFFSDNKATASTYKNQGDGGRIVEAYLNVKNPLVIDANGGEWTEALSEAVDKMQSYRTPEEKQFMDIRASHFDKYAYEAEYDPESIPAGETEKLEAAGRRLNDHILANKKLYQTAKRKPYGHDGIIVRNVMDSTAAEPDVDETGSYSQFATVYIAFEPTQIKAVGNRGTFDPKSPKITEGVIAEGIGPHKFASTQFNLPEPLASKITSLAARIPDVDLAEDGREDEPHVTCLYGLSNSDPKPLASLLQSYGPVTLGFGGVSIFAGDKHDVVKIDVVSPDLHRLNATIADAFEHTDTYPDYKPHVTLVYVKPGEGSKYVGESGLEGESVTLGRLVFSDQEGERTEIVLGGPAGKSGKSLSVPHVRQSTDFSCGRAALLSALQAVGVGPQGIESLGTDPANGTSAVEILDHCKRLGLPTEARSGCTLDDIAAALAKGAPCIAAVTAHGGGHWVVISEVITSPKSVASVTIMDPADDRPSITMPADDFMAMWHDETEGVDYTQYAIAIGKPENPAGHCGGEGSGVPGPCPDTGGEPASQKQKPPKPKLSGLPLVMALDDLAHQHAYSPKPGEAFDHEAFTRSSVVKAINRAVARPEPDVPLGDGTKAVSMTVKAVDRVRDIATDYQMMKSNRYALFDIAASHPRGNAVIRTAIASAREKLEHARQVAQQHIDALPETDPWLQQQKERAQKFLKHAMVAESREAIGNLMEAATPIPCTPGQILPAPDIAQERDSDCGEAISYSAGKLYGVGPDTQAEWRAIVGTTEDGTSPQGIISGLSWLGLVVREQHGMTLGDLAECNRAGQMVLCPIQDYTDDPDEEYGGHWVGVIGAGLIHGYIIVQDPSADFALKGQGSDAAEGRVMITEDKWLSVWHDTGADGTRYVRYGIVVGPGRSQEQRESLFAPQSAGQSLLREDETAKTTPAAGDFLNQAAIDYLRSLLPRLGTDVGRVLPDFRRTAFTLAVATEQTVLDKVQATLLDILHTGAVAGVPREPGGARMPSAVERVQACLDAAGVSPANPQYAAAVVRSNLISSYNQGYQDEFRASELFPWYVYSNPQDSRSRPHHAKRDGNYYDKDIPFEQVRGLGPEDAVNCRCTPIALDRWTVDELKASGAKLTPWP